MVIINLTPEKLQELINAAVTEGIKSIIPEQKIEEKRYLTLKETAEYINLSESTIYKLTEENAVNKIPHIRPNKKILFIREELDEWLKSYR